MMKLKLPPPFEELMHRHEQEILRFLYRLTANREDALDLFQETWLRAYRAYPEVDAEGNLRAWLFSIAANLHRSHRRGQARRIHAASAMRDGAIQTGPGADAAPAGADLMLAHLRRAIDKLPHKQRAALVMRKFAGLDYGEIAEQLGCSDESARANVSQALRKLKAGWLSS
jgi:RNA polymerase sigma-70 factor (ECF subfamily)